MYHNHSNKKALAVDTPAAIENSVSAAGDHLLPLNHRRLIRIKLYPNSKQIVIDHHPHHLLRPPMVVTPRRLLTKAAPTKNV
jgi:hypothetical protein